MERLESREMATGLSDVITGGRRLRIAAPPEPPAEVEQASRRVRANPQWQGQLCSAAFPNQCIEIPQWILDELGEGN